MCFFKKFREKREAKRLAIEAEKLKCISQSKVNESNTVEVTESPKDSAVKTANVATSKTTKVETVVAKAEQSKERSKQGKIEIYKDTQGKFRFRILGGNRQNIAISSSYESKQGCKNGYLAIINADKKNGVQMSIDVIDCVVNDEYKPKIGLACFEIYKDKVNLFRFRFRAANLELTLTASEGYTTKSSCRNAIDAVMFVAYNHIVSDLTK